MNIPSTSTHEHDISLFVEEMLRDLRMEIIRLATMLSESWGREGPVLALCGHLDTVLHFSRREFKGESFRKGAADDKGGLAAVIMR